MGCKYATNPVEGIRIPNGIIRRDRRLKEGEYELLQMLQSNAETPIFGIVLILQLRLG